MPVTQTVIYQKSGATFSSGLEAHQDKNSLYSAELKESIEQCHAQLLANNILLGPDTYTWDQATEQLTIQRVVSDGLEFGISRTYDINAITTKSAEAGWLFISSGVA
jgi:hypothetical protein